MGLMFIKMNLKKLQQNLKMSWLCIRELMAQHILEQVQNRQNKALEMKHIK